MAARQLIPKVVHRVWLGPNPVPELFERYAESWARNHPDWEMRLWTDENLPPLKCQAEVERASDFKSRYDSVRLEILRQHGGVIIDLDMECLRSLEPILDDVRAFAGASSAGRRIGNQVLGAVPNHPFFELAVDRLKETVGVARTASQESGPGFINRLMREQPFDLKIFPREYFFSLLTIEPPKRPQDFPNIYAVHHHFESYRDAGRDMEVRVLQRRLSDLQYEVERLTTAKPDDRVARCLARIESSRWWRLGQRLRIVNMR
jgi:inositol phosphorylceramide mannosyltransferase catalytic subunit